MFLLGGEVRAVERRGRDAPHFSGNTLERIVVQYAGQEVCLVLKRFQPRLDWIRRLAHDTVVREAALSRSRSPTKRLFSCIAMRRPPPVMAIRTQRGRAIWRPACWPVAHSVCFGRQQWAHSQAIRVRQRARADLEWWSEHIQRAQRWLW